MRKFLLFLSVLFVGLLYAKADTATIIFSELGYANAGNVTSVETGSSALSVVAAKGTGSNDPKYYTSGSALRMYKNTELSVKCSEEYAITNIEFTCVSGKPYVGTPSVGNYSANGATGTWTGSANDILFKHAPSDSSQWHIVKMVITYEYVAQSSVDPVNISYEIEGAEGIVTLACPTEGATIYYGYSEDEMTNVYTAPFKVTENCTVYTYAEKDGEKSKPEHYDVVLPYTSFKKVIENTAGTDKITIIGDFQVIYVNGDKKRLILTDGTSNLLIYKENNDYTIDYAVGTQISKVEGSVAIYNECFRLIDADLTEGGNGCAYSPVELTSFSGLTYEDNIFDEVIIKNCIISGKNTGSPVIELDGESVPLYDLFDIGYENGVGYELTGFVWRVDDVLKIVPISIEGGVVTSETVATPVIKPSDRELNINDEVTIECATVGAVIYYTLDGSEPTQESEKYTAPIPFTESCTIKARAYYEGEDKAMLPSVIASRDYHVFDPTCNVISEGNHDADEKNTLGSYVMHSCVVDGVEYHMNAAHYGETGNNAHDDWSKSSIMMNNNDRFSYLIQVGENEGYVLDRIEVGYNQADSKIQFAVRGSNTPFDDSAEGYDGSGDKTATETNKNKSKYVKPIIEGHGNQIGTISVSNPSIEFNKDYKYFALYPTASGAVYLDNITIYYREAGPLTAPKLLGIEDLDEIDMSEFTGAERNVYFYDDDQGDYLVVVTEPLMVDFDIDLEDNPDVEIYYVLTPYGLGMMNTLSLSDDDDDPDMPVEKYNGSSIEINSSSSLIYWARKGEDQSEQVIYNFMIMTPFEIPDIKGLEKADVKGDAESGYVVESDKPLSITFDYDAEFNLQLQVSYKITYENGESVNGQYSGTPIVIDKDCEMLISARNANTGERAEATYMFFITSDPVEIAAPKIKEGSYIVDNGHLMSNDEVEIEFETVEGIHIYYTVVERNVPAKVASTCEKDHSDYTKHEGETVKLNGNHESFSFFACNPETGAHSETVTYQLDIATGVLSIEADNADARYFNLQGVRIAKPENGTYIRVQNGKSVKIVK